MKRGVAIVALVGSAACSHKPAAPADAGAAVADVQILSMSTWLGQIDPVSGTAPDGGTAQYGGLAALSSYFQADRKANPNTLLLMAADSFGASPPISAEFADEPAVKALGFLHVDADMLGNHDFNEGIPYLQHLVDLSAYPYVATNLRNVQISVRPTIAAPYALLTAGPVKVGVLGVTSTDAPNHTTPGRFGDVTVEEPIAAANAAASEARAAGASVVVVLTDLSTTGVSIAGTHTGPLMDFAASLQGVDVVIGYRASDPGTPLAGHTLVVEHEWKGLTYGRTHVRVTNGAVVSVSAEVVVPDDSAVVPDPAAANLIDPYRQQLMARFEVKVGVATGQLSLDGTERTKETALGDVVADAYLEKYRTSGAQIAVMNSAGIRDSLPSSYLPADKTLRRPAAGYAAGPPWDLVAGDATTVLPFGDFCVVRPITGATLWAMLEQSVFQAPQASTGFLQIAGFKFTYSSSAAPGARVQSVTLDDGTSVGRADTQSIVLVDTDYLDSGGDNYGMLIEDPPAPPRDVGDEVLLEHLASQPQIVPGPLGRITQVP